MTFDQGFVMLSTQFFASTIYMLFCDIKDIKFSIYHNFTIVIFAGMLAATALRLVK